MRLIKPDGSPLKWKLIKIEPIQLLLLPEVDEKARKCALFMAMLIEQETANDPAAKELRDMVSTIEEHGKDCWKFIMRGKHKEACHGIMKEGKLMPVGAPKGYKKLPTLECSMCMRRFVWVG